MLSLYQIRVKSEEIAAALEKRNFPGKVSIAKVVELDKKIRQLKQDHEDTLSRSKKIATDIGKLYSEGKGAEAEKLKNETGELKQRSKELFEVLQETEAELHQLLLSIPNAPHASVPAGAAAEDNEILREWGEKLQLSADAVPHWDLTSKYDLIDFEAGVKITGSGFPLYKGKGARLQRALVNFFLDRATEAGYLEVQPPILINAETGYGTGQLPDKEGQMYHVQNDQLYLIPTAEVPVTNIYRDVILKESDFPVKLTAYTPCFRREAGSYGKDVRGLNRLHQFDKVEIVRIEKPEDSYQVLEEMVEYVESLLQALELPYRVAKLCAGDLGFAAALTYDMEVWSAGQQKWLEVSSVSNFETFQSNRLKLRYKTSGGKTDLAHTLNGSALAFPRIVAALLENNQTANGIKLPKALAQYTGFDMIS
ncbi:MAG: serine--tRNA ligase [Bacteroidia bacterium]